MNTELQPKTKHQRLLDVTFIAVFAALCYIALTVFFFPFAHMYIHFGNLLVVLAALLVGGWQGGLAGSIGMGFFDIFNGHAESSPKTFLLKFLIGLTVGAVYHFLANRKKYPTAALSAAGGVSLAIAAALIIRVLIKGATLTGKSGILALLFVLVGLLCFCFALFRLKLDQKTAAAAVGAACGMLVNVVGETAWKFVEYLIAGSTAKAATAAALVSQSSTLINAGIAIIGGVALFRVLEKPFARMRKHA